jgi:hyperosmotically inducible protein
MRYLGLTLACAIVFVGCNAKRTPESNAIRSGDKNVDADKTGRNVRDRDANAKTPIDQNENQKDIGITAKIRKRVVDTKMSVNAQNVKIITQDGRVTLRGPVKSADEKERIAGIAEEVAGNGNVDNQIEVEITQ